jgi:glycosyltransferase involved in cell wall biosynthesis
MNIISLGSDRTLFNDKSNAATRLNMLGEVFDKTVIIVHTLVARDGYLQKKQLSRFVTVIPTNSRSKFFMLFDMFRIAKKILREANTDEWVTTTQDPFFVGLLGVLLSRKYAIPFVVQLHTDIFSQFFRKKYSIQYLIAKYVCRQAKRVRVVRGALQQNLVSLWGIPQDRIVVLPVYLPIPYEPLQERKIEINKAPALLVCARLSPEKNIHTALYAFAQLKKEYDQASLTIVGDGIERQVLEKIVRVLHLSDAVSFVGWQTSIKNFLLKSDILLVTSYFEGYGMVMVEAASVGCPIVTTPVGIAEDLLATSVVISNGYDVDSITSALKDALQDPNTLNKNRVSAFSHIKKVLLTESEYKDFYRAIFTF